MNTRFALKVAAVLFGSAIVLPCGFSAQQGKSSKFAVGDKVEVEWAGKKVTAEVVELPRSGWVKVKFKFDNIDMNPTLPPDKLKPLAKGDKAGATGKAKKSPSSEPRTWSDTTGKFKIEARFVELKDDQVTLERLDGQTVTLDLDKLSDQDQKVAKELAKKATEESNPFEPKDSNPFEPAGRGKTGRSPAAPGGLTLTEADWSAVDQVVIEEPDKWALTVEAAAGSEKQLSSKAILLNKRAAPGKGSSRAGASPTGSSGNLDSVLFLRNRAEAYAIAIDKPGAGSAMVTLQHCDLAEGKAGDPIAFSAPMKPVDIDSTGEWLLARTDFFVSQNGVEGPCEVGVWKIGPKGAEHKLAWNPNEPENIHKTAPTFARFVDYNHVLTVCFPGKLVLWDVTQAKAVYKMELSAGGMPAVSPGGKYLAAPVNNGLYLFDALTGKTVGKLTGELGPGCTLSFRPDGKQIAALSPQRLQVWNAQTGELYRDIYFSWSLPATKIDWLSEGYVMVGGENLVDLERRIVLWQYQHDGMMPTHAGYGELGGVFWYGLTSRDRTERGLFRAVLPHDEAKKTAASLKPDDLLAVKPGTKISLRVNVRGTPEEQQRVSQALTARLNESGMVLAGGGRVALEATTEAGETKQIEYRKFGLRGGTEKASVADQISRLRLTEDGKTVWESVVVGGSPHMLHLKQGQTLQEALNAYQKPNLDFFGNVRIPQYIARPNEKGAYGASSLTPQGLQPAAVRPPPKQPTGKQPDQPNQNPPVKSAGLRGSLKIQQSNNRGANRVEFTWREHAELALQPHDRHGLNLL